ncbi:MAG: WD40/YVTN/BNR-like repeat-containing protein, partial [Terriglobales bacterium]
GAWKTDDAGRTWRNFSDAQRLTGIGAVAVDGATVYLGANRGANAGVYRSTGAGAHLEAAGLDGQPIAALWLDPHNPRLLLAASPARDSPSTDGGGHWQTVLTAATAGGAAVDIEAAADNNTVLYAAFRAPFRGRGRAAGPEPSEPPVFVSTDAGRHWKPAADLGLPATGRGRPALAVAPGTHGRRLYAYLAQGVFRSDDAAAHWRLASADPRLVGGGQFFHIYVDPTDARVLYLMQTAAYRSTDAGATWQPFTGAPSGDDFNAFWMDPSQPLHMALSVDQGTEISLNGGQTWSTWYNQPTGQLYNVSTDHRFPFFLYSSQQDSGTLALPIFGNDGQITYRDWTTTNGFESARIAPDPLHPGVVFTTAWFGGLLRTDLATGRSVHVFERRAADRESGSPPLAFLPDDPQTLLMGLQYVLATHDGGQHWQPLSPDLTAGGGAAITALAPAGHGIIWAGTSDGRVQLTNDNGKTWRLVTPPGLTGRIASIEPSRAPGGAVYVVVGGRRGAGAAAKPAIYTSTDNGSSWLPATSGLPPGSIAAVREDTENPQLIFAAADSGVFVSFDGGSHWQSLELNLPASSVTDLQIEQSHLVISTYGRGLWSLDDIGSLRQMANLDATSAPYFFQPTPAIRLQWDDYTDTPINPDEPHSPNPPDGAAIAYSLPQANAKISLNIYDSSNDLVNSYSSDGPTSPPYLVNVAQYWLAPPQLLPKQAGLNQFVWNLRYPDPPHILFTYFGLQRNYFEYTLADHAIPFSTPWHEPQGPMVLPGDYRLQLTVNGQTYSRTLTVKLDPRLNTVTQADLETQLRLEQSLVAQLAASTQAYDNMTAALENAGGQKVPMQAAQRQLGTVNMNQARLLSGLEQADGAPGTEVSEVVSGLCRQMNQHITTWNAIPGAPTIPERRGQPGPPRQSKDPARSSASPSGCAGLGLRGPQSGITGSSEKAGWRRSRRGPRAKKSLRGDFQ